MIFSVAVSAFDKNNLPESECKVSEFQAHDKIMSKNPVAKVHNHNAVYLRNRKNKWNLQQILIY